MINKIHVFKNKSKQSEDLQTNSFKITNKPQVPPTTERNKRGFIKKHKRILSIIFIILVFFALGAFAYTRISSYSIRVNSFDESGNEISSCTNILNPECWTDAFTPQLKQTDGFTNALIVGLDTRSNGSLMNTDSLMMISYNHATQKSMLLSIPRDFFSFRFQIKISAVYAYTSRKDKDDPWRYLKEDFASITGRQIHYVIAVKLDGVTELVDAVGGVSVCPYADFTAKYPNPNATPTSPEQWLYYDFKKGCQDVDGERALVYSRFRSIRRGPGELASDFSRARRQQEIVDAVKVKLLGQNLSIKDRTENYWSLLQTVDKNIKFDFTFEDFLAGLALIDKADKTPARVVLDPNFGGPYRFMFEGTKPGEGYTVKAKDQSYNAIKNELSLIWDNIDFYKETPKIVVRNQTGSPTLGNDNLVFNIKNNHKYWSGFDIYNDGKTDKYIGVKLFDFTGGTKPGSLAIIQTTLGISEVELLPETYGATRTNKNEDFLILVGPTE